MDNEIIKAFEDPENFRQRDEFLKRLIHTHSVVLIRELLKELETCVIGCDCFNKPRGGVK